MANAMERKNFTFADVQEKMLAVKVVLSDIEGTTTSIPFVRNVLKSYCKENLRKYIRDHWEDAELLHIRREMDVKSTGSPEDCTISERVEKRDLSFISEKDLAEQYILRNIDSKQAPIFVKLLQTKLWEEGYVCSDVKGHLFPDVTPAFKKWTEQGLHIYIYSSGIKLAQKLLFTHSLDGDVHELISGFFDLDIGPKVEPESYKNIMEKVNCQPENAVFLTDNVQEAEAAQKARMIAMLVHREGNEPIDAKYHKCFPIIYSFEEITSLLSKGKLPSIDENGKDIVRKKAKLESEDASSGD